MRTILEHYKGLKKENWDYYNFGDSLTNPFKGMIGTDEDFKSFINQYFISSGKRDGLFNDNISLGFFELTENRGYHTVSVFFLGLLIRKHTFLNQRLYNDLQNKPGYPTFPFIWFLSVLFHDFGMFKEHDLETVSNFDTVEDINSTFDIHYKLLLSNYNLNIPETLFTNIEKYFKYRISEGKLDHGILGGLYLYGRLVELRKRKKAEIDHGQGYNGNKLNWDESLDEQYALAASVLCCHNIYLISEKDPNYIKYEIYKLLELDKSNFKKIDCKSYPLFFLFGLVDTLDPVKTFLKKKYQINKIINNIRIKICKRSIRIVNDGISEEHFNEYYSEIFRNLDGWLDLKITRINPNTILVKF